MTQSRHFVLSDMAFLGLTLPAIDSALAQIGVARLIGFPDSVFADRFE